MEEEDYTTAFAALNGVDNIQVIVCDSGDETVQQALRSSLEEASATRRERIAVVGMSGAGTTELTERAEALNSERMVLVGPDVLTRPARHCPVSLPPPRWPAPLPPPPTPPFPQRHPAERAGRRKHPV